ncbi:MAG TPA: NfeD family protein [Solirubrobacterales bacterium]|jgi:membrane-bound serine protease (ClpP class)|nr:NfeD family protein [Solirubrobacterales bacterium]
MEAFVIVALIGIGLLAGELLLPTGGLLAAVGIAGLVVGGILAIGSSDSAGDYVGGALITLAILSAASFFYISRKVIRTTRHLPKRAGTEEMVGGEAEARSTIDPTGQAFMRGTLWSARLADGATPVGLGDRVKVEAVDGLTLVVAPVADPAQQSQVANKIEGAS